MLDTTNWASFPFTVKGVNFVSKFDTNGAFYPQVKRLSPEVFYSWHNDMIAELIGDPSLMTRDELSAELDRVNLGANQAIVCLA